MKKTTCDIDYGNQHIPLSVRKYEQKYVQKCGGWDIGLPHISYANVEVEVARFYYSFINLVGAKYILETGTNTGYSTAMIAAALSIKDPDGVLYTIDINNIPKIFENEDFTNVRFLIGNSITVSIPDNVQFDILIIDSDHSYSTVMRELIRFEPLLKTGGYILMHDTHYFDGVGLAVSQLCDNPRFEKITLEAPRYHPNGRCTGVSIIRKNNEGIPLLFFDDEYAAVNVYEDEKATGIQESYINKRRQRRL